MDAPGKPYVIQRPHLQTPPPFLDHVDMGLLQTLVKADADWLQYSSGSLPLEESWPFLQRLLASQRCFIEQSPDYWTKLIQGSEQQAELTWAINALGEQQLSWRPNGEGVLFFTASCAEPCVYQTNDGSIARCQHTLSSEAIQTALPYFHPLPPHSVELFLQNEGHWRSLNLPLPVSFAVNEEPAILTPALHCFSLKDEQSGVTQDLLQLQFRYCNEHYCVSLTPDAGEAICQYWDGYRLNKLMRQSEQETFWRQKLTNFLGSFTNSEKADTWQARDEQAWRYLLTEARTSLQSLGFHFCIAGGFRHHYVIADRWQAQIGNMKQDQWQLSVQLATDGGQINLLALLAKLKHINHTSELSCLRLEDGRLLLLPAEKLSGLMDELGDLLHYANPNDDGSYRLPGSQINRLNALHCQLPENTEWRGNVKLLDQALGLHQAPAALNQKNCRINAQLRPYQWQGVCWLQHLKQHNINGLLADDMGLGKTLQTLAHLCLERQQGNLPFPALIVAPTSLLHNWAAEIKRFAPHLRWQIIHGPQRHQHWPHLNDFDIVISSYSLIVNDLRHWQRQPLSWVVLDEAQWIKNPRTQASQAVRQLNSRFRLCLSGTPVENHLGELWSILDFLMPNCLGGSNDFKRYFQKPIEQRANSARLQQLLQRVAPFLLRRTKDQVAGDLPAKTEIYQTVSLADDQQAFYDELKSSQWSQLQEHLTDTPHGGQQQILLLTALLKLRQACCDPHLLGETQIRSSKREHCVEMIEELVAEQRAILVFSQFTAMLELLAQDLKNRGIDYLMLTGQTRKRQALVNAFQQGEAPVFLISLKAGGVGLNLTRADTVIHYDPWWNNAAEQQATDRAHRIGQDKPVFVYKLIAENTIEEKIAELQQRKALLGQHINHQAQASGEQFALKLEELLALWGEETASA